MTQTPAPVWTPPGPRRRDTSALRVVAFSLIGVWAASASALAAPLLLHDALHGSAGTLSVDFASLGIFVLGMNVWLAALGCGIVAVALDPGRRVQRSIALALLLMGSVVAIFLLSGWHTGNGDDNGDTTSVLTHATARGAGVLGLLAALLIASKVLLRVGPPLGQLVRRPRALAALGVVLALVVGLGTWLALAGSPSVTIKNDTAQTVSIRFCPRQACPRESVRVSPGHSTTFNLPKGDPVVPDSVTVTAPDGAVDCVLVDRAPELPTHMTYDVTDTDAQTC